MVNNFYVAMGSYMGAEICDLIGLYILFDLNFVNSLSSFGIYRDDGLAVLKRSNARMKKRQKELEIYLRLTDLRYLLNAI